MQSETADSGWVLIGIAAAALSGGLMGFVAGAVVGAWFW